MMQYLAIDSPYRPHNLEQTQYGLGGLVLLIIAVAVLGKALGGNRQPSKPAAPARGRVGKGMGVVLVIGALVLIGKSSDNSDTPNPAPSHPVTTPSHKAQPTQGSPRCSLICFKPKN